MNIVDGRPNEQHGATADQWHMTLVVATRTCTCRLSRIAAYASLCALAYKCTRCDSRSLRNDRKSNGRAKLVHLWHIFCICVCAPKPPTAVFKRRHFMLFSYLVSHGFIASYV